MSEEQVTERGRVVHSLSGKSPDGREYIRVPRVSARLS